MQPECSWAILKLSPPADANLRERRAQAFTRCITYTPRAGEGSSPAVSARQPPPRAPTTFSSFHTASPHGCPLSLSYRAPLQPAPHFAQPLPAIQNVQGREEETANNARIRLLCVFIAPFRVSSGSRSQVLLEN